MTLELLALQVIQQIKQLAKPILKSWRRKRKEAASLAKQAKVSGAGGLSGCGWLCARVLSHRGGMPAYSSSAAAAAAAVVVVVVVVVVSMLMCAPQCIATSIKRNDDGVQAQGIDRNELKSMEMNETERQWLLEPYSDTFEGECLTCDL